MSPTWSKNWPHSLYFTTCHQNKNIILRALIQKPLSFFFSCLKSINWKSPFQLPWALQWLKKQTGKQIRLPLSNTQNRQNHNTKTLSLKIRQLLILQNNKNSHHQHREFIAKLFMVACLSVNHWGIFIRLRWHCWGTWDALSSGMAANVLWRVISLNSVCLCSFISCESINMLHSSRLLLVIPLVQLLWNSGKPHRKKCPKMSLLIAGTNLNLIILRSQVSLQNLFNSRCFCITTLYVKLNLWPVTTRHSFCFGHLLQKQTIHRQQDIICKQQQITVQINRKTCPFVVSCSAVCIQVEACKERFWFFWIKTINAMKES